MDTPSDFCRIVKADNESTMFGIHHDGVDVDHRADRVEVHLSALLGNRDGQDGVRQTVVEETARQRLRTGWRGPLPDADGDHPRRQQQHVAALDRRRARLVGPPHPEKPRMVGVDQVRQRRLPDARGQRQRRDRHPRPDPERGVPREEEVRKRIDDEVGVVVHPLHERRLTAEERQLAERHASHQDPRQVLDAERSQIGRKLLRQRKSQPAVVDGRRDAVHPRRSARERLGQQIGEQEHLDATRAQQRGERVVLLLSTRHPRHPVEQQSVVVARGQPLKLGPRAVQDDDPQRSDLRIGTKRRPCHA